MSESHLIPAERIERRILLVRGQKVLLDFQLAELYEVETKALNQAVKRNLERFPEDFMFQLSAEEAEQILRSQTVMSSEASASKSAKLPPATWSQTVTTSAKFRRASHLPFAFTEQGVAMLSSVLRSPRAVQVNIAIMRTFVQLRQLLSSHADLAKKLASLESKYDQQFKAVFDAIRELMKPPTASQKREMGFHTGLPQRSSKPDAGGKSKLANRKSKLS
jgi:hypothetical protein